MKIIENKIYLVPFSKYHLRDDRYFSWIRDKEVVKYIGRDELLKGITLEQAEEYVEQIWADEKCNFFAIHDSFNNEFIGTTKLKIIKSVEGYYDVGDVGVMIGAEQYRGKGLSKEILRACSKFGFKHLKLRKLVAGAYQINYPVIKGFLRIGYQIEGRIRNHFRVDEGFCDQILLGCFEQELVL